MLGIPKVPSVDNVQSVHAISPGPAPLFSPWGGLHGRIGVRQDLILPTRQHQHKHISILPRSPRCARRLPWLHFHSIAQDSAPRDLIVAGWCRSIERKLAELFKKREAAELLRQQPPPVCTSLLPAPMPTPAAPPAPNAPLGNTPSHRSIGFQSWARPLPPPYQPPKPPPYQPPHPPYQPSNQPPYPLNQVPKLPVLTRSPEPVRATPDGESRVRVQVPFFVIIILEPRAE